MAKVLVADDEEFVVGVVRRTLSRGGYDVVAASDGYAALSLASTEQPGLILLDANMPSLDGFEALKLLRQDDKTSHIPVLMMTGRRTEADVRRSVALGANGYLAKPFSPNELLSRVGAILRSGGVNGREKDSHGQP